MKWLHLADLHLGRRLDNFDLMDDQADMLRQVIDIAREEHPDGVLIAGDVYDRSVPSGEAVRLLDGFLTELGSMCPVFIISGNHDSGERLSFAQAFLARQGVHVSGRFDGCLEPVTVGDTDVYLMPYAHPQQVRDALADSSVRTMQDAVSAMVSTRRPGSGRHAVLVAHLFVTAAGASPERSDSEISPVGTLEQVDASLFDAFDYVALGHIHGPQRVGRDTVRYAGSPLPYSFSEEHHRKSVAIWDPDAAEAVRLRPIIPLRRMRTLRGEMEQLLHPAEGEKTDDFIAVCLTDALPQLDAASRLRQVYPNLVHVTYARRYDAEAAAQGPSNVEEAAPEELFAGFYQMKTGQAMDEMQMQLVHDLLEQARKEAGA